MLHSIQNQRAAIMLPKPLKEEKPKSTDKAERETKTESMTLKSFIISCLIIVCCYLIAAHIETKF